MQLDTRIYKAIWCEVVEGPRTAMILGSLHPPTPTAVVCCFLTGEITSM